VATFYVARSEIITPLPWQTFALPFSVGPSGKDLLAFISLNGYRFSPVSKFNGPQSALPLGSIAEKNFLSREQVQAN
jgi:hypothetical protein